MIANQTCPNQEADECDHREKVENELGDEEGLWPVDVLQRQGDLIVPGIAVVAIVGPS